MKKAAMFLIWVYVVLITIFFCYKTHEAINHEDASIPETHLTACAVEEEEKEPIYYETKIVAEEKEPVVIKLSKPTPQKISLGEFKLTAYCSCVTCCEEYALNRPIDENGNQIVYTASGNRAVQGVTVAVDPALIPYGTELEINGNKYIAHDCGGDIKEKRIDVYFENHQDAWNFGTQYAEVFLCQ